MKFTPTPKNLRTHIEELYQRCEAYSKIDPAVWTYRLSLDELHAHIWRLESLDPASHPLFGVPFAIKDNIDLEGVPTTAGCPEFAYTPKHSAPVVQRLIDVGAIPIGKTNLDQFATGLVGTRSPYGIPRNVFNRDYISGGSSSGSAVAVAAGLVDFALGTDTAGSGRVPAAFNQLIGVKPTRGLLSSRGVVPACRSLDCVSIFANNIHDAALVLSIAEGYDEADAYSREPLHAKPFSKKTRIGVPKSAQLEWFGNNESPTLFAASMERFRALGHELVEIDFAPFLEAARLLYEGPWTAERYAAVGEFIEKNPNAKLDPTVAGIILGGKNLSASAAFSANYKLAELRRKAESVFKNVEVILAPTTGTTYTVSEVQSEPLKLNSNLGRYNNFMNLLDLSGLTLPAGRYASGPGFGVTLIAPAWQDRALLKLGAQYNQENETTCYPKNMTIQLTVCGAHLRGQPLHKQLTELNAEFVAATTTSEHYRLYALANTTPPKPGLVRVPDNESGSAIEVEVYALSFEAFGKFVAAVPPPLVIGTVELANGTQSKGFLCEPRALVGATDITQHRGWIAYMKAKA